MDSARRKYRRLSEIQSNVVSNVGSGREVNNPPPPLPPTTINSSTQLEGYNNRTQVEDVQSDTVSIHEDEEEEVQVYKVPRVSFDSDDSGDELEKDALGRQRIRPKGNTFQECSEDILGVINHNIDAHFNGAWISLRKVPKDVTNLWWNEFQKHFFWRDRHAPRVKANWRSKCSQHIRNVFCDHRASGKKPSFLSPEDWTDMLDQWKNNANYKCSSARNKRNRASKGTNGTSRYAGGSRSVVQNVDETEKKIGRRMTQDELMSMMYHSRKKGKWMGDRPQKDMDRFNKLCIEWKESHPEEEMTQDQINKLWLIATGGEGKGRIPGQGSLYRKMDNVLNPAAPAPSVQPSPASLSSAQVRSSSVPIPNPLLPRCVSPTPRVASPSGYESSIEARMQRQDELIERLLQQLHQPGQQRLDTNRSHIIMPSTTMASSNMSFQPTPSPSMSFQPMPVPSSSMSFQPMHVPSSSMSFQPMHVPSSSMSFQAMPTSNMSYQALLQSTEPNVYGDVSAGRFAPSGGAYGDGTTRQN